MAGNSAGTTNGTDHTFMTTPCVPGAPTITSAKAGNTQASIYFSPPASDGGGSITGYIATSSAGTTQPSLLIPITVSGLINGTSYNFTVTAINSAGPGTASAPSNSVTPGLVINGESDAIGYLTIMAAYTALNNNNAEIHIQAGEQVGDFVKAGSGTIVIIGGYDSTFISNGTAPSFLSNLTLSGGTTKVQHVVVRPNGP